MLSLNLKSEHCVLETVNRLEAAVFAWKHKISEDSNKRAPVRYPWYFKKGLGSELENMEMAIEKAEMLIGLLKTRFPNLPQTFIDLTKVRNNKVSQSMPSLQFQYQNLS